MVVWECALRGKDGAELDSVVVRVARWLKSDRRSAEAGS